MKRLLATTALALVLFAVPVFASHFWNVQMSTPQSLINEKSFNVEYKALSVERNDDITVELFQNDVSAGSQTTTHDFGDSGNFPITVPADGTYQYKIVATNGAEDGTVGPVSVTVDTTAPAAPTYHGKSRSGNSYTLSFTAPSDADVAEVRIYSSASTNFTANAGTQVGLITVNPGETRTFSYVAGDSNERFHALQAFDDAGNFSPLVTDPDVVVTQGTPASQGVTADNEAGQVAGGDGTVAGDANGNGIPDDQEGVDNTDGQVLGEESEGNGGNWLYVLLGIGLLGLAYYFLIYRPNHRADS